MKRCDEVQADLHTRSAEKSKYETYKEDHRVVEMDAATKKEWDDQLVGLFKRLYPKHDWKAEPIEFLLADSPENNAWYSHVDGKNVITLTKGLIEKAKNLDTLAWVLGHEYGHLRTRADLGEGANSKGEEALSDIGPLEAMEVAGLDATAAREFFDGLDPASFDLLVFRSATDAHPLRSNRISIIDAALAKISLTRGGLNRDRGVKRVSAASLKKLVKPLRATTPVQPEKVAKKEARKAGYGEGYETPKQVALAIKRIGRITDRLKAAQTKEDRANLIDDFEDELASLQRTELDGAEKDALNPILQSVATLLWKHHDEFVSHKKKTTKRRAKENKPEGPSERKGGAIRFRELFRNIQRLGDPTEEIVTLFKHIDAFTDASTQEAAKAAADTLMRTVTDGRPQLVSLTSGDDPLFVRVGFLLPGVSGHYERGTFKKETVPWNSFVAWADADKSGTIRQALLVLGVQDARIYAQMSAGDLVRQLQDPLYLGSPNAIPKYSSRTGDTADYYQLHVDNSGKLVRVHKLSKLVSDPNDAILRSMNRDRFKRIIEAVYSKAVTGDEASLKKLRLMQALVSGFPEFSRIVGRKHLLKNPRLFFEMNETNLFESIHDGPHEGHLASLLSHLENLAEKDKANHPAIREIFLKHISRRALGDIAKDYTDFAIQDVFKIFSQKDKVRLIERFGHYGISSLVTSYERNAWRRIFGLGEVRSPDELLARLDEIDRLDADDAKPSNSSKAPKTKDPVSIEDRPLFALMKVAEIQTFLKENKGMVFPIEAVLGRVPAELIRSNEGLRTALMAEVEKMKSLPNETQAAIDLATQLSAARLFPKDGKLEDELLQRATQHLSHEPDQAKRRGLAEKLMASAASEWPLIRKRLNDTWIDSTLVLAGDKAGEQETTILTALDHIAPKLNQRDRYFLITELAERARAQEHFSKELKKRAGITRKMLESSQTTGVVLESLLALTKRDVPLRDQVLTFLGDAPSDVSLARMEKELFRAVRLASEVSGSREDKEKLEKEFVDLSPSERRRRLEKIHANFWSAPLEARAVVVKEILLPQHPDPKIRDAIYAGGLFFVIKELFPPGEAYSAEARQILIKYGNTLSDVERPLFIAAAMAATERGRQGSHESVGRRLAHVLEIMGPAEIKLGQAIHSFDKTPEDIRADMTIMKHDVDPPTRWELFELLNKTVPDKLKGKIKSVEERLGAASYYYVYRVEMEDGKTYALALLKNNARARSEAGFRKMLGLIEQLKDDPSMKDMVPALREIVDQARKMAAVETDFETSKLQSELAEKMYRGREVSVHGKKFVFDVARSLEIGEGYRLMDLAEGRHYNNLPVDTAKDLKHKKDLGLAYHTLELANLLSGKPFDEDRHGAQMKVQGDRATLYDFGALKLIPPTSDELQAFGKTLHRLKSIVDTSDKNTDFAGKLNDAFLSEIRSLDKDGKTDTGYLPSVHKAWLALADFRHGFEKKDFEAMFGAVTRADSIHPEILAGYRSQMNAIEMAKLFMMPKGRATIQILK